MAQQGPRPATLAIHADDHIETTTDVAPPLHVSTTYRYTDNPDELRLAHQFGETLPEYHVYSRFSITNTTRLETTLSSLLSGPTITYASGLASFHALITYFNPRRIAIGGAYHGVHDNVTLFARTTGLEKVSFDEIETKLGKGDIVHLETPLNPTGEAYEIKALADRAHKVGALLVVDATFAPPPLQEPFAWGADVIMHSGTKYIGGHSDMLCGVLVLNPDVKFTANAGRAGTEKELSAEVTAGHMRFERGIIGGVMGNLEGWLGLRSVRTMGLRLERASKNATELVRFLNGFLIAGEEDEEAKKIRKVLKKVTHASLQHDGGKGPEWLNKQMPNGFGPVFSILLQTHAQARRLPSKVKYFHHATSLGGVESLIELRAMSDRHADPTLLRLSIGIEDVEDLKEDLKQALLLLADEDSKTVIV